MLSYLFGYYNYWIIVLLMMMGLYAVFAAGNLVKRLVGLGVFQTSVFLLYITIGKVAGGIPPILPETHHGGGHGAAEMHEAHEGHRAAEAHQTGEAHGAMPLQADGQAGQGPGDAHAGSALDPQRQGDAPTDAAPAELSAGDDHGADADGHADHNAPAAHDAAHSQDHHGAPLDHGAHADHGGYGDQVRFAASDLDVVYSNPLPHVLILTAIVVGVATLAVGLALVVRICDAYGSIEDEDINRAEFETEAQDAAVEAVAAPPAGGDA